MSNFEIMVDPFKVEAIIQLQIFQGKEMFL
jgi:hypothetical protein